MSAIDAIALGDIPGAQSIETAYIGRNSLDYESLIKEITDAHTSLDEDPVVAGILNLNGLIAQIDAQKTRVANIVSTAIENENFFEELTKRTQGLYTREFDARLPQSPCADFSNAESRKAACGCLLGNVQELQSGINGSYSKARAFTKIANTGLAKLDSTNKNISRQITVLQLAVDIGEIARPEKYTFDNKP